MWRGTNKESLQEGVEKKEEEVDKLERSRHIICVELSLRAGDMEFKLAHSGPNGRTARASLCPF